MKNLKERITDLIEERCKVYHLELDESGTRHIELFVDTLIEEIKKHALRLENKARFENF